MSQFFPEQKINILQSQDFNLDHEDKITIKNKSLNIVLFYKESPLSNQLLKMWEELSESLPYINFCKCDLNENEDIAIAFSSLLEDKSSHYTIFGQKIHLFIIVYKDGKPLKNYNQILSKKDIKNYLINHMYLLSV